MAGLAENWIVNHPAKKSALWVGLRPVQHGAPLILLILSSNTQAKYSGAVIKMRGMRVGENSFLKGSLIATVLTCSVALAGQPSSVPPAELVRRAVQNEIGGNGSSNPRFMFKDERKTAHLWQTKLLVETSEATAGMVIAQDGHSLTPQQMLAEDARLQNYIHNPDEVKKKNKQEKEDTERTTRILKALPDAFFYEADGTQPGTAEVGRPGDQLVRLKFRPNPNYEPPSRVEQVLTGMRGYLLIDSDASRIAEIDGTLEKDVSFGWGFLAHLDRGGRFVVRQADIDGHHWQLTRMELSFTGKMLLFKSLNIRSSDTFSDFHQVPPDLTFAEGVELLKKEVAQMAPTSASKPQQHDEPVAERVFARN